MLKCQYILVPKLMSLIFAAVKTSHLLNVGLLGVLFTIALTVLTSQQSMAFYEKITNVIDTKQTEIYLFFVISCK